jgi:hypothetical protein
MTFIARFVKALAGGTGDRWHTGDRCEVRIVAQGALSAQLAAQRIAADRGWSLESVQPAS